MLINPSFCYRHAKCGYATKELREKKGGVKKGITGNSDEIKILGNKAI
jgi:hypothetical protein